MDYAVVLVDELNCIFEPARWDFARDEAAAINAFWQETLAAKPKLFNGRVLLQHFGRLMDVAGRRRYEARYFETDYRTFLAWRAFGRPDGRVRNGFALAALRAADGAFLAGEMAPHTASGGRIYFPGGTPDPQDLFDGKVDLAASVRRELMEETGLGPADVKLDPGWTLLINARHTACLKIVRVAEPADALAARIHATLAGQREPELARMHILRRPADWENLPLLADFMPPFLRTMRGAP